MELSTPVKYIKRVGERVAAGLAERGIETVEDLLYHLPFRYEDRLHPKPLAEYRAGEMASIVGEVRGTVLLRTRKAPIFEMTVGVRPPFRAAYCLRIVALHRNAELDTRYAPKPSTLMPGKSIVVPVVDRRW